MSLNLAEIKKLIKSDTLYPSLGNLDALSTNYEELHQLTAEEKVELATNLILACPASEMMAFSETLNSLKEKIAKEKLEFHTVLGNVHEVKSRILALTNPKNDFPHVIIMEEDFSDLLNEYNQLALKLIDKNEVAIATRFAMMTPNKDLSRVSSILTNLFSQSSLPSKIQTAFSLRREVEMHLLSDSPENFFSREEYNPDVCHEFSLLFTSLLEGSAESIGTRLSRLDSKVISDINRQLELLSTVAHDKNNPLKKIATAMHSKETPKPVTNVMNPHSSFNSHLRNRTKATTESVGVDMPDSESDDEEEKQNFSCCGLGRFF